jgi:hypothetical protein
MMNDKGMKELKKHPVFGGAWAAPVLTKLFHNGQFPSRGDKHDYPACETIYLIFKYVEL